MARQPNQQQSLDAGGAPFWLTDAMGQAVLDVRPLLSAGQDPFSIIVQAAEQVSFGGFLVIDAPFNPSPLRRVLAARGFSSYGRRLDASHWRIFFHLNGGQDWEKDAEVDVLPEGALSWREPDGLHLDVRKLTPPQPMLAILRTIDGGADLSGLVIHHDRMPELLIPELAERGWKIANIAHEFAEIRLWLEAER